MITATKTRALNASALELAARARLSSLGRVTALAVRPCGDWIALDATIARGGRVECLYGVGPNLDAVVDALTGASS